MQTLEQLRAGTLAGVTRLKLRCALSQFPREIFDLADTLEILDLSGNALSTLPDDLPRLGKLRILFCSDNQFTELPGVLGSCPQLTMIGFKANRIDTVAAGALPSALRWLILTDNRIETLPAAIGNCRQLQKLMLAGNLLRALPQEMANCTQLELLRIAANRLTELPPWLLRLPRLSWLACAGNPLSQEREFAALADVQIASIDWDDLQLQQQLGEGASGVIHRARYRDDAVALKIFKGEVTSDGLPRSEMAACISAGAHPNLIPILGQLTAHPTGASGMLMPLIDAQFINLAGPPSLASCTRDSYPQGRWFDLTTVLALTLAIASAAAHLHRAGIMHGDLYGHNILYCDDGRVLLGDFGAASLCAPDAPQAQALQRIEVRAFGLLLEELLERCNASCAEAQSTRQATLAALADLSAACRQEDVAARPHFDAIERSLAALANAEAPKPVAAQ
jgi:predicted Ser/Thr protein kinase